MSTTSLIKALVLTCEHYGNSIPEEYQPAFRGYKTELKSHLGYDIGAAALFEVLKANTGPDFSAFCKVSRLLVDVNRSIDSPDLFAGPGRKLSQLKREEVIRRFYTPYRERAERTVKKLLKAERDLTHISVHTFTPVLGGRVRDADIGILFDPAMKGEAEVAEAVRFLITERKVSWKVMFNSPYKGVSDGLVSYLRGKYGAEGYKGLELEVSQKLLGRRSGRELAGNTLSETVKSLKN